MNITTKGRGLDLGFGPLVAATLLGSAVVHATVVEEHLTEWPVAGAFFVTLVVGETLLAVASIRLWGRPLAMLVVGSSVMTVATWTVSRTVGMPIGPLDFRVPEPVGVPDLACCALEIAAVVISLGTLSARHQTAPHPPRALVLAVLLSAVLVTGWGSWPTITGAEPAHHHVTA